MKLRKDKWSIEALNNVCDVRDGTHDSPKYHKTGFPLITSKNITKGYIDFSEINLISEEDYVQVNKRSFVDDGDILLSMIGTVGVPVLVEKKKDFAIKNVGLIKFTKGGNIINKYLLFVLQSEIFQTKIESKSSGTAQKFISLGLIRSLEIPLPPLEEQKQIAALFQSIETAMEQVDGQEKNMKALWKRLIDEFVSDKPSFGNLLKGKELKTYNYCDVTEKLMRKIDPLTYGIERIVAGENLESEDFKIRTWQKVGEGYLGPAFHVLFKAGDILYGSRRTYLRKVSHADFDGVCANTTYVIKANEELLLQDLLKHIMLSERFTQYSIGVSKGSTNPYINWKDLDNFSFQVPDIETQKEIAYVLDGILQIVEQLKQQKATLKHLKQKLLNEILG